MNTTMEKHSRNELCKIIEEQNEKLTQYKTRLKDLIRAYKGLLAEKEALESSLKVLTTDHRIKNEPKSSICEEQGALENAVAASSQGSTGTEDNLADYNHQIKTLTTSLATLSTEKSRIESSLLAEKKKLMQEKDDAYQQLHQQQERANEERDQLNKRIQELKNRIREQQQEREREQHDHALMLRELQHLLAEERATRESVEQQLDVVSHSKEKNRTSDKKKEEYEKLITDLKQQLREVQERLRSSEVKSCDLSLALLELKKEMEDTKAQNYVAVTQEKQRANEAEETLRNLSAVSEERVANLESRLSELSQMLGNYDRLRQQDQISIVKLKERVIQLDLEKNALSRRIDHESERPFDVCDDSNLDVQTLISRINRLKHLLKIANQRSEQPVDLEVFYQQEQNEQVNNHSKCQQELQQLKEEFENYKLRAQSVIKNKASQDNEHIKELEALKNENLGLKDKVQMLKYQLENSEKQCKIKEESFHFKVEELKQHHNHEILELETEYKVKLSELEQQMKKQRERTFSLLQEKENEIKTLKSSQLNLLTSQSTLQTKSVHGEKQSKAEDSHKKELLMSELDSLTNMLSTSLHCSKNEGHLLHYAHELARKDVEIANLRSARHQAESALRELQQETLTKEESFKEDIASLCSKIQRMESSQSNKGINMEYLKNVVLQYVMCSDPNDRKHMINAIATVLHFTPRELEQVKHCT